MRTPPRGISPPPRRRRLRTRAGPRCERHRHREEERAGGGGERAGASANAHGESEREAVERRGRDRSLQKPQSAEFLEQPARRARARRLVDTCLDARPKSRRCAGAEATTLRASLAPTMASASSPAAVLRAFPRRVHDRRPSRAPPSARARVAVSAAAADADATATDDAQDAHPPPRPSPSSRARAAPSASASRDGATGASCAGDLDVYTQALLEACGGDEDDGASNDEDATGTTTPTRDDDAAAARRRPRGGEGSPARTSRPRSITSRSTASRRSWSRSR